MKAFWMSGGHALVRQPAFNSGQMAGALTLVGGLLSLVFGIEAIRSAGREDADVILVGVSRCGKTPTSLYLAMQYGIKAANCPLIPEDFERGTLPSAIQNHRSKLFGLSIQPERLSEVRNERRPGSKYATIEQCRMEVAEAERLMRMEGIPWLSTTTKSIEEISTKILDDVGLDRRSY